MALAINSLVIVSLLSWPSFATEKSEVLEEKAKQELNIADERAKAKVDIAEQRAKALVEIAQEKAKAEQEASQMRIEAATQRAEAQQDRRKGDGSSRASGAGSARVYDRLGAYLSIWGEPHPTTLGVNLAYNIEDFLRINLGVGSDSANNRYHVDTVGLGVKALVPGWSFSPSVGVNLSNTTSASSARAVGGFSPGGIKAFGMLGLDWQTPLGVYVAVGYANTLKFDEAGGFYGNLGFFL